MSETQESTIEKMAATLEDSCFVPHEKEAREWAEVMQENFEDFEACYNADVDEIETAARSGFIPFINGGFITCGCVDVAFVFGQGSTHKGMVKLIEEWEEIGYKTCLEEFGILGNDPNNEEHIERQYEYIDGWVSGTYYLKAAVQFYDADNFRNETGTDEVLFRVYLCQNETGQDCEQWGTRSYIANEWSIRIPVSDLTPEKWKELTAAGIEAAGKL